MSYVAVRRPYSLSSLGIAIATPTVTLPSCDIKTGNEQADAAFKKCCEDTKLQASRRGFGLSPQQAFDRIKQCSAQAIDDAAGEKACDAVQTGITYIDEGFRECCQGIWKGTGDAGERAKKIAICTANASASAALTGTLAAGATALCAAAGPATAGITTFLAATGVCAAIGGTVGVFLYNRISGYSPQALVLGIWAGAVCGVISGGTLAIVCGFAMAELVEWLSNHVGPLLEGIFDPDAAERRQRAEERAAEQARRALESSLHDAQTQMVEQWQASVNRIWDLYEALFPSAQDRAAATAATGIANTYDSVAHALLSASKHFPTKAEIKKYAIITGLKGLGFDFTVAVKSGAVSASTIASAAVKLVPPVTAYDAAQRAVSNGSGAGIPYTALDAKTMAQHTANHQANCEIFGRQVNGSFGPSSSICPPIPDQDFLNQESTGPKKPASYYQQLGVTYSAIISDFFALLPLAEAFVANTLTTFAALKRLADSVAAAQSASRAQFAAKAAAAASRAEAAADAAAKGNAKERAAAILRAKQQYDIAVEAQKVLLATMGDSAATRSAACEKDAACQKANLAVRRAAAARDLAVQNAAHAATLHTVLGAGLVVGAAGAAYLLLRQRP